MNKKDVEVNVETVNVSPSTDSNQFVDKKEQFQAELQELLEKYNFIIYAANTLIENWEVIPTIRIIENVMQKEDANKEEEVITIA